VIYKFQYLRWILKIEYNMKEEYILLLEEKRDVNPENYAFREYL